MIWGFLRPLVWCEHGRGNGYDTAYSDDSGAGMGDGTDNSIEYVIYGNGLGGGLGGGTQDNNDE